MSSPPRERPARALFDRLIGTPLSLILVIVAVVLVNVLSARHYRRFDWTRSRRFSLSPQSQQIVRSLHGATELYVLMGSSDPKYQDVVELAQRYAAENHQLSIHVIDPDRQRDRFLALTQQLGLRVSRTTQSDVSSEAAIVLVRGTRHWEIPPGKLAGLGDDESNDEGGAERVATAQLTVERAITEGLLHINRTETTPVCISSGHDEIALEGGDSSMSQLATVLRNNDFAIQSVTVRGATTIPPSCEALIIAGPRQAFTPADAQIVTRYLEGGGNVLLLLDPFFVDRRHAPNGLESVAALGGIELTPSIVIEPDPEHQIPDFIPATFLATELGDHPITRQMRGRDAHVLVTTARALRRLPGSSVIPESLMRTTNGAWGETSTADSFGERGPAKDSDDIEGPIHLAMASQIPGVHPSPAHPRSAAGRMVVIGYSHLATNEALAIGFQARFMNDVLVLSSIGWLTDRREMVEIPARPISAAAISVSRSDLRHVDIYAVLLVPLAAALVGIAVWRARKAQ